MKSKWDPLWGFSWAFRGYNLLVTIIVIVLLLFTIVFAAYTN